MLIWNNFFSTVQSLFTGKDRQASFRQPALSSWLENKTGHPSQDDHICDLSVVPTVKRIVHLKIPFYPSSPLPMNGSSTRIIIMTVIYFICVTSPLVTFVFTTNTDEDRSLLRTLMKIPVIFTLKGRECPHFSKWGMNRLF